MINKCLYNIQNEHSFSKSSRLIKEYKENHPDADLIYLHIGDVSKPIVKPVIEAMKNALDDLSTMDKFQGYGLYWGHKALREKINECDYKGIGLGYDEIYIGCGTKTDSTSILELFDINSKILISKLTYPIYVNGSQAMSRNISLGDVDAEFKMIIPKEKYDIIYLCSPCNPVGNALNRKELKAWIDYALENNAVILYDNVYRTFIESDDVPITAYELEGAKKCVIEMRSYSKDVSFSSMRCSYYVIPKEFGEDFNPLWRERCVNRFNGATYVSQMGALASYSDEAQKLIKQNIKEYKENGHYLREELTKLGYEVIGGIDAPYLWAKTKDGMSSWESFNHFLNDYQIAVVPGTCFGEAGENYMRISSLGSLENSKRAIERMKNYEKKN